MKTFDYTWVKMKNKRTGITHIAMSFDNQNWGWPICGVERRCSYEYEATDDNITCKDCKKQKGKWNI